MAIRMAKLKRTPSGLWTARKVIPEDVRAAYGKREEKPTWAASLTQSQAKAEFAAWLSDVEVRIAALRSNSAGNPTRLTQRQVRALAGRWYERLVAEYGDNPGEPNGWEETLEALRPEHTEASYAEYHQGGPVVPYEGPWRPVPSVVQGRDRLLQDEALRLDEETSQALLDAMLDLYVSFCDLMIRRAGGDYREDPLSITLPKWERAPRQSAPELGGVPLLDLFDGYVAEREPAPSTVKAWRRLLKHFVAHLGHDDASRVTAEDVLAWKDKLLTEPTKSGKPRSAKTVRETYLAALRAVLTWGVENRRIASNASAGIKVRGPKRQRLRDPGFTDSEALTILRATLQPPPERLGAGNALARRWVPWVCAYTGARVNEITQLRAQDVCEVDGVWAIRITPEAGSVKNDQARVVPLHPHIIEQGFLLVAQKASGPLFYDPALHRGGSQGNPQYKKVGERLAEWVRKLGIDDPTLQPNHAWRHRFKTIARQVKMDPEARDQIPGHAPRNEGASYGAWPVAALLTEIEKLPRHNVI